MDILRQKRFLTESDQVIFYNSVIKKTFSEKEPDIILFSFMHKNVCIGYGGLTNIDWTSRRAELSFLSETERARDKQIYSKDFSAFLNLITDVVFIELNFNRLFTETFDIRPAHIAVLEKNGFILEGRLRQHAFINNSFVDLLIHGCLKEALKN